MCTHTRQVENSALRQNWQSSEKSQNFKEKNTIFNEHPVDMKTALVGEFNDATMVCAALAEVGKDDISGRLLFIGHFLND